MDEIKNLVVLQGRELANFIEKHNARLEALETDSAEQAKQNARDRLMVGGFNDADNKYFTREKIEHKDAFLAFIRTGKESALQVKSMSSDTDPDGGYLLQTQLDTELTKYLRARSPMRQIARIVNVDSAEFKQPHSTLGTGYA